MIVNNSVDFKSSFELVLYVWFIPTLNQALNWIETYNNTFGSVPSQTFFERLINFYLTRLSIGNMCNGQTSSMWSQVHFLLVM